MMENNIANQKKLKEDKDAERYYKQKKQYERNVEVSLNYFSDRATPETCHINAPYYFQKNKPQELYSYKSINSTKSHTKIDASTSLI